MRVDAATALLPVGSVAERSVFCCAAAKLEAKLAEAQESPGVLGDAEEGGAQSVAPSPMAR